MRKEVQCEESPVPDSQRSATGLGYDCCGAGRPMSDNPFVKGSWKWDFWRAGWLRRKADNKHKEAGK